MEKTKPIILNSVSFAYRGLVYITEPIGITFQRREDMERHISRRRRYWSRICGVELEPAPSSNETLVREEVQQVLKLTCDKMGLNYEDVKSKSRLSDYVEARRIAVAISVNRKVMYSTIARALNLHHATVLHHSKRVKELCEFDRDYRKVFINIEDYVLIHLAGSYSEDGSGKKINNHEND